MICLKKIDKKFPPVAAARLQRRMTEHVVKIARRARDAFPKGDIVMFCLDRQLMAGTTLLECPAFTGSFFPAWSGVQKQLRPRPGRLLFAWGLPLPSFPF